MIATLRLFRVFSLRYLFRRKLRFLLATTSVVLAVALFVSMRVTEASILRSFEESIEALSGKAEAVVTRGSGIEAAAIETVEKVGGLRAAPVIQEVALAPEFDQQLMVLGIDFVRDARLREYRLEAGAELDPGALLVLPNAVLVPRSLAARCGLVLRSALRLQTRLGAQAFSVAGIFADEGPAEALGGNLVLMSLAGAQRAFGRKGRVDRIEVAFEGTTAAKLRAALGPEYTVAPIPRTNPLLEYQLAQLRIILFGVSVLAMLIGAFIIFNSLSLSVVERVKEIGILRALGARRREVVGAIALEAACVGLLASGLGVLLGIAMSRTVLSHVAGFVNIFLHMVDVSRVTVPPAVPLLAAGIGVVTAVAGGLVPALAASRVPPMVAIRKASYDQGLARNYRWSCAAGVVLFAGSLLLGSRAEAGREEVVLSLISGVCGFALVLPQLILACSGLLRLLARRFLRIEGTLAVDSIVKHPVRTSLTVIAFAGSLSLIVTIGEALASFESTVDDWLRSMLPWDLTIQLRDLSAGVYSTATFPEELLAEAARDERVAKAYGVRVAFAPYQEDTVMILAIEMRTFMEMRVERGLFRDRAAAERMIRETEQGAVVVSENFAYLHRVRAGDEVEIGTPLGARRFRVLEETADYSWPRGVIVMDRAFYRKCWDDDSLTYLDLRVRPGTDVAGLKRDFARSFAGRYRVFLYETKDVLDQARRLVRQWFRLADAQILLAIVIGGMGVVNTLLISLITRTRQIGILRAIGASRGQVHRSLAVEAAYVGAISGVLGCAMGLFVAKYPMNWITLQGSGYALPFVMPWSGVALACAGGVAIGLLASLAPARFVDRIDIIDAIGYE